MLAARLAQASSSTGGLAALSAAAASRAWLSSSSGSRSLSASAAPPPPPPPADDERAASLPTEQLAKALLAGNVRAQLTTARAGEQGGADESKVSSSVVPYLSPRGEAPIILLDPSEARQAQHLLDMGESAKVGAGGGWEAGHNALRACPPACLLGCAGRPHMPRPLPPSRPQASLATGHVGPAWFIQRLRATGWLPRRVALLGTLQPLPAADVRFAVDQARSALAAAPALAAQVPAAEQLPGLAGFRLGDVSQAVYVDARGKQHPVAAADLDSAFLDPLAHSQHDLLAAMNTDAGWQEQLRLFCAAYLGVHATEVLLTEADRMGFSLLGRPPAGAPETAEAAAAGQQQAQQRWRQFRIGSSCELRNPRAFLDLLEQMREEVKAAAAGQQQQ